MSLLKEHWYPVSVDVCSECSKPLREFLPVWWKQITMKSKLSVKAMECNCAEMQAGFNSILRSQQDTNASAYWTCPVHGYKRF